MRTSDKISAVKSVIENKWLFRLEIYDANYMPVCYFVVLFEGYIYVLCDGIPFSLKFLIKSGIIQHNIVPFNEKHKPFLLPNPVKSNFFLIYL